MEDVAFDAGGAVEPHAIGADRALDPAADRELFGDDVALDLGAIGDQYGRSMQLAFDAAENFDAAGAGDLSDYRHAGIDRGNAAARFGGGDGCGRRTMKILYRCRRFKIVRHSILALSKHVHTPSLSCCTLR